MIMKLKEDARVQGGCRASERKKKLITEVWGFRGDEDSRCFKLSLNVPDDGA
jgi:ribosomal protein L20